MAVAAVIAALNQALISGQAYTSVLVTNTTSPVEAGQTLQIGYESGQTQNVVVGAPAPAGSATIVFQSFIANANYGAGQFIGDTTAASFTISGTSTANQGTQNAGGAAAWWMQAADGAQVTIGSTTDAASANTVVGLLKKLATLLPAALGQTTKSASLSVTLASDQGSLPTTVGAGTPGAVNTPNFGPTNADGEAPDATNLANKVKSLSYLLNKTTTNLDRWGSLGGNSGLVTLARGTDGTAVDLLSNADSRAWSLAVAVVAGMFVYNPTANSFDRLRTPVKFITFSAAATGTAETTIWTPAAGKKFRLMGWAFLASVAGTVTLRDNTAGTIIIRTPGAATDISPPNIGNGILSAAANNVLTAQSAGAASTLTGLVFGTEE